MHNWYIIALLTLVLLFIVSNSIIIIYANKQEYIQ
jgi:cell division protein FtsX